MPIFVAAITAVASGFILPLLWSGCRSSQLSEDEERVVWLRMQEEDCPLTPWPEIYSHLLDMQFSTRLSEGRPSLAEVRRALRSARRATIASFVGCMLWCFVVWPLLSFLSQTLSFSQFILWVRILLPIL
ncbi:unnamed protein product [Dibothriocephalus latus]|uniref:Uncharacterized protein n=1 Tax=Dibothriocephalus latus TaxID=60516 RepID=A0A3P7QRX6_DIBLA|nr:unnamed protein product [Dibothriocephalus latus]